jgi:hypothetical protein
LKNWRLLLSAVVVILIALVFIPLRREVAGMIVNTAAYAIWAANFYGSAIPQQVLWFLLLILISYIAVSSFYGRTSKGEPAALSAPPAFGPVEALARRIDAGRRGVYFKWQIANMLGKIHQTRQQAGSRGTSGRVPSPPAEIQAYLDAGVNTSYADYPFDWFKPKKPTPFDIELTQVLDYLEDQMEIEHERRN